MGPSIARAGALALAAAALVAASRAAADSAPPLAESTFLSRIRQLTFEGQRAGEGYFSPDGDRIVFQSEREPGNPFFQIYELDLATGDVRRISTGVGKTTCAFYQPGTKRILFASTHHDPRSAELQRAELEFRASGQSRRYEWDFDPEMELYVAEPDGTLRRLTEVPGYDAEGSYSPDGKWIVFTSTRTAHPANREPVGEAGRRAAADPSYFAEIYLAREDGTEVRRLTDEPGYDGGPFFTADGERIVWRRFRPEGDVADVWTMRRDGSDARRLTDLGSMSWAPYPDPSGRYVVFTSNELGFGNFELFVVDSDGRREPVRVTYTDGFDGLPVLSPDARLLAWTSNRRGGGGQLMLAEWNHRAVLDALQRAPLRAAPAAEGP